MRLLVCAAIGVVGAGVFFVGLVRQKGVMVVGGTAVVFASMIIYGNWSQGD